MINPNYFLLNVALLVAGTIIIRGSFIFYSHRITITPKLRELFTFIPAAIFPAIMVPAAFFHQGQVEWLAGKERFAVLILASAFCFFVRQTFAVILFGLCALYLLVQAS